MNTGWIHISTDLYNTRNLSKHTHNVILYSLFNLIEISNTENSTYSLLLCTLFILSSFTPFSFSFFPLLFFRCITLKLIYNTQKTCQIQLSWTWGPNKRKTYWQISILEKSMQVSRRTKEKFPLITNLKLILSTFHRTLSI